MQRIRSLTAVCYPASTADRDISSRIAPPYDVLDAEPKAALLAEDPANIVAVDLPHTPPKVVGPDAVYEQAGQTYRQWLDNGTLIKSQQPAMYAYQQAYTHGGRTFKRRGLIAGVAVQPFGAAPQGRGGVWAHERTFSSGTEDRLKLMRACGAQLSPIFGLYQDNGDTVAALLERVIADNEPTFTGTTSNDDVTHDVWEVTDSATVDAFSNALGDKDIFIADGHHRYTTAINYCREQTGKEHAPDHPAGTCMFVLVSMDDPGMIVLPTHRVLGGMSAFSFDAFVKAAEGKLSVEPFDGDLEALEAALPNVQSASGSPHAMGLVVPDANPGLYIATTTQPDPLADLFPDACEAWRQLDVAILQHLVVERILQPTFCDGDKQPKWKFPHRLADVETLVNTADYQLGVIMQPTPLQSVKQVSEAGELMPQKSTFFYPKLATGLVINPLA